MARFNQFALGPNRPPRGQRFDANGAALSEAKKSKLAEWGKTHGFADAENMIWFAKGRRALEIAREVEPLLNLGNQEIAEKIGRTVAAVAHARKLLAS